MKDFLIEQIGDKRIILKGIGKMFYEQGFPVSMSVAYFKERGIEVSILHVADECMKNGWGAKTTYNKIKADFADSGGDAADFKLLEMFCYADYERQREIIFSYLFEGIDAADWLRKNISEIH